MDTTDLLRRLLASYEKHLTRLVHKGESIDPETIVLLKQVYEALEGN